MRRVTAKKHIIVLGCGPAGIFAAHAAVMNGHKVSIYSCKRMSEMHGAQYLHQSIPGLSRGPYATINYSLAGTTDSYAQKVYGDERPPFVSPESLVGSHYGWDIRDAYREGWNTYRDLIVHAPEITHASLTEKSLEGAHQDLYDAYHDEKHFQIISTIPALALCNDRAKHTFKARSIWAVGEAPERGVLLDAFTSARNSVICNGEASPSWYRFSNVFGYKTIEWPDMERRPPYENVVRIEKVISTNCDCFTPRIWRAGRMGTWSKSVLSHHAFYFTYEALGGGRL